MIRGVFERFDEAARLVIARARAEAIALNHEWVGSEHELLGLLTDPDPDAVPKTVLRAFGVTAELARQQLVAMVGVGDQPAAEVRLNPRAKRVIELALRESLELGARTIAPEHLLLALTREGESVGMRVLVGLGADGPGIRAAVMPLLPAPVEAGPQIPRAFRPQVEMLPSPDRLLSRLLTATSEHALSDGRTEFDIGDFLASVAEDEEASSALASLGVDVHVIREAIKRRATDEEMAG
jgi:hypothetical protein